MTEVATKQQNLRIPGPTPLPDEVKQATSRDMMNHRGPEFSEIFARVTENLKYFYQTESDILTYPSSGTGAMEATVVNLFSPGDQVLAVTIGSFGDRFAKTAEAFGLNVTRLSIELGKAAEPSKIVAKLQEIAQPKGVLITHNETSTGVMNDIPSIIKTIRQEYPEVLIAVDAVSSLGCVDLPMDASDIDVLFTASQKGWMVPPGLAMIGIGPRAWKANELAKLPRMYWDFKWARKYLEKNQTPYTPPVQLFYGLDAAFELMKQEGREAIYTRHHQIAEYTRRRVQQMGLSLFADPSHASDTVTSVKGPDGVEVKKLLKSLREEDSVVFAGGQETLDGKIFRIAHLGFVNMSDISAAMDALEHKI